METLKAVIVDDEVKGRKNLQNLLNDHCPEVEVLAAVGSAQEARLAVGRHAPDVVFLDIHMPVHTGFDFLDFFTERSFDVVFVTAYDQYAIRAIKASAVDYILKPIDLIDLKNAVKKLVQFREVRCETNTEHTRQSERREQMSVLMENIRSAQQFDRIILHLPRGIKIVRVVDILYLKAESNYSTVHLKNGENVTINGSLKEYEEILDGGMFRRTHKSYLVNLLHIEEYFFSKGGFVALSNGEKLQVSTRRVKELLAGIETFVTRANKQSGTV